MNRDSIVRSVAIALTTIIGTFAAGTLRAQDSTPADAETSVLEEVIVTGSRIARTELEATSAVAVVGRDDFDAQGFENFADLAASLPQFSPSFGTSRTQSTFSGTATSGLNSTNLRNLTPVRTVVLINGRRVTSGSPVSTFVDFNTIPTANVERTEILTGGAAAVYGADAVAGVVNLITRKNFEGIEIGGSYSLSSESDNENPNAYLLIGGKFADRGHGLLTLEYDFQGEVACRDRFLCAEDFAWTSAAVGPVRGPAAYSGVAPAGRFFYPMGVTAGYTQRNGSFADANGLPIPFVTSVDGYNRNAERTLAIPTRRVMLAAEGTYELARFASAFVELNYGSSKTEAPFEGHPFQSNAAGSLFGGSPGVAGIEASIPLSNPFVPAALFNAAVAAGNSPATTTLTWFQRLNGAGGDRGASNNRESVRAVAGLRGEFDSLGGFGEDWSWEVSHVYGRHSLDAVTRGLVGTDRLYYALRVEPDPANPGAFRCIDAGARAAGCVPVNPFAPYTDQMRSYLGVTAGLTGRSQLENTVAYVTGSVAQLPAGPLRINVGLERREFGGYLDADEAINRALVTGNQLGDTAPIESTLNEAFLEAQIPLLEEKFLARKLSIDAAYRRSNPDRGDDYGTWKYGFAWVPIEGFRFRAERARTVRTPVPGELSGTAQSFGVVNDPCTAARRNANATRASNCAADGVPGTYAPLLIVEQSVAGVIGANPNLAPEVGTTLTYGVVLTPSLIDNFAISIDRFAIDLEGIINTVGRQTKANLCYDSVDRLFCNDLTRGTHPTEAGPYVLRAVNDQLLNISATEIAGIDVAADYAFEVSKLFGSDSEYGRLSLRTMLTFYDKAEQVPLPGQATVDLLGAAGGSTTDQGFLRRAGTFNARYAYKDFSFNWNLRHIGRAKMAPDGFLPAGFPDVGSHTYHNVRLGLTWGDSDFYIGVNNLFDKEPPFFATGVSGTQAMDTIPAYYDVFGRTVFGGFRAKF
jgi:iron complex outermembrane recepter protein